MAKAGSLGEGRELGISRLQSRRWCPSVSANLAWPKSQGSGAAVLLKGVTWGQGQQLCTELRVPLGSSGEGAFVAGSAGPSLGSSGCRTGIGRASSSPSSPQGEGLRGFEQAGPAAFQLFFTGFTGLGYQELQLPGPVWRPPLNWFGKELSSKMAPPVSLSRSHFLHSLI